jgi:tetratricopeptide (TPR) repeat protein
MRARNSAVAAASLLRRALALAAAWSLCACAAPGARPSASTQADAASGGFTLRERVRVSSQVRGDFEDAVRLLEQERYTDGIALLVKVTEAAPQLTAAHIDLGMAYGRVNELERAAASLERALELNPRHPVALNELGIVYRRLGRFADARERYEKALALHPEFHFARRNLAILCDMYVGDASCALEHYGVYVQAVPNDEAVAMWAADLRTRAGR